MLAESGSPEEDKLVHCQVRAAGWCVVIYTGVVHTGTAHNDQCYTSTQQRRRDVLHVMVIITGSLALITKHHTGIKREE